MTNISNEPANSPDSQVLLNQIILEYMREKRHKRIRRWVFRLFFFVLLLGIAYMIWGSNKEGLVAKGKEHVGLIEINGEISADSNASSDNFAKGISKAYANKALKAMIIRIDSPGGSPVQADYIFNSIRYYHTKYPAIKIYAVCVDSCASAAYYIASAADEIYANPASLVGSIGVVYNGFGFVDAMQKLGVSRRLQTAGANKGFLDPFSAENPNQEKLLQDMLNIIHQQFIDKVKLGRGNRLKIDSDTFTGLFWTGVQAKERGLIDGFASSGQLAREVIALDKVVNYTHEENVFDRMAKNIGSSMANKLPEAMGMKSGLRM